MRLHAGRVLLSASDLNTFLGCRHASALDHRADILGEPLERSPADETLRVLQDRGYAHEAAHLAALTAAATGEVAAIARGPLDRGVAETIAAMRRGAEVVAQGVFEDGVAWHGYPDFLVRGEVPSSLGPWSYEVHDTKLARSARAKFALQLAVYADLVGRVQGSPPPNLRIVLGDGSAADLRPRDVVHYARRAMRRLEASLRRGGPEDPGTAAEPCAACAECGWTARCEAEWEAADHLHAVCNIRGTQVGRLRDAGIATLAALAALPPGSRVPGMDDAVTERLRAQAALQASVRGTPGERRYELLDAGPGRGLARLPDFDPHDLFFDMEGDPLFEGGGLEYLFGVEGADGFRVFWGLDRAGEKRAFEDFMDHATAAMGRSPGARIYHYNHYEPTALRRLAQAHATREAALDRLLREHRFVDLYVVVREAMRTSELGLSLKNVEHFYRDARTGEVGTAGDSIVEFERWVGGGGRDPAILKGIEDYNRDDCISTRGLRDWLLTLGPSAVAALPDPAEDGPDAEGQGDSGKRAAREVEEAEEAALAERLRASGADRDGVLRPLAADLLGFHRREAKPEWWAFFDRQSLGAEELLEDLECLAGLEATGPTWTEKRSTLQAYRSPEQETKLRKGATVVDAVTGGPLGTIRALDVEAGSVTLGRGTARGPLPSTASLGPGGPLNTDVLRRAVRRFAEDVAAGGGRFPALEGILRREAPRIAGAMPGAMLRADREAMLDAALRACRGLEDSHLLIQGPPGTGKTWVASRVILDALRRGLRVGVSAFTHKAIINLLTAVERAAEAEGAPVIGFKKSDRDDEDTQLRGRSIEDRFEDRHIPTDAPLIGGTAFFWSKPERERSVDLMVVDEAGQVSLANLVALGTAARSIVLVGDQMQLGQPTKGVHPGGGGASALGHLLGDAAVVPPDRGIFLDETRRMHPAICRWVSEAIYDGRLLAHPSCAGQAILPARTPHPAVVAAGLRFVGVDHEGNSQHAPEEVEAVVAVWRDLQRHSWRDAAGTVRPIGAEDVLVVSPWNAQVNALRRALPSGARVGTVDRFQGQEAAAVVVSMATSGTEPIPRGTGFLFSRERLNVAVSRARCLALVVASPRLLDVPCATVEDLRLVNTLCWLEAHGQSSGA